MVYIKHRLQVEFVLAFLPLYQGHSFFSIHPYTKLILFDDEFPNNASKYFL